MAISAIHQDIIETHILTRLDGPTLASAGCASSQLYALCTQEKLWRDICTSTWPSVNNPLLRYTVSTFPAGYQSFYSDSFPTIHHQHQRGGGGGRSKCNDHRQLPASELISAVDIHYEKKLVYSKVKVTETVKDSFLDSPLWVGLLGRKEAVETNINFQGEEENFRSHLEQHMALSWIVIDPTQKRAANISSLRPVSAKRHWLTGEIQLQYSTIMAGYRSEFVHYRILIMCGTKAGGMVYVREVSLQVEDMDGKCLSGKESLIILREAMESGKRKKGKRGEEKERYEEFLKMKRERRERKLRREMRLCIVSTATAFTIFLALLFWLFRRLLF